MTILNDYSTDKISRINKGGDKNGGGAKNRKLKYEMNNETHSTEQHAQHRTTRTRQGDTQHGTALRGTPSLHTASLQRWRGGDSSALTFAALAAQTCGTRACCGDACKCPLTREGTPEG